MSRYKTVPDIRRSINSDYAAKILTDLLPFPLHLTHVLPYKKLSLLSQRGRAMLRVCL